MAAEAVALSLLVVDQVMKLLTYLRKHRTTVGHDVENAKHFLERMRDYLKKPEAEVDGARVKQIRGVAYSIEDALDEYLLRFPTNSHTNVISRTAHRIGHAIPHWRANSKLASEMATLKDQIDSILAVDHITTHVGGIQRATTSQHDDEYYSSAHNYYSEENETVGFAEMEARLSNQIMEVNSRRVVISIVGPTGSGKTTLVKNVYKSNQVEGFFTCDAWVEVPRPFDFNKVLRTMLRKLDPESMQEAFLEEDTYDLKERLKRFLSDKRFVIVLDNIRSKPDLEMVANVLPDGLHGSKIIVTTCNSVSSAISSSEYTHDLKGLEETHAWELFCKKAFPNDGGNCPNELKDWATKIMHFCEGLPLAISTVGAALAIKPQTTKEWKSFYDSLGSEVPILSTIWEQSFNDLPNNLKTCFLYFGMFPEGYPISRARLIRLWIAEGFVKQDRTKTIEKIAEGYLKELVDRNLVVVTSREIDGKVKLCRVLNIFREFIIPKAKHFITVLEANSCESIGATQGTEIRRLSVDCNHLDPLKGKDLSLLRTLIVFGDSDRNTSYAIMSKLQRVLEACKLLRVLDSQGASYLESFPKPLESLTLLRYLNLSETKIQTIPRSIKKLGYLETFDVKQTKVTTLPQEIDRLQNLRNLLAYRYDHNMYVHFEDLQGVHASACNIGALTSMQKLSLIRVPARNNIKFIEALGELKSLKRLGLRDLRREDGAKLCIQVPKMKELSTFDVQSSSQDEILDLDHMTSPPSYLQHLYMKGRLQIIPKWVPQLESLMKVGLKWTKLKAELVNPFEALEKLPNLMKLELVNYYLGEVITFKAATFKKLVTLTIEEFEALNFMAVESDAMPLLEKLTMSRCNKLKLLPVFGVGDLQSLKEVRLHDMCHEFIANFERDGEGREAFQQVGIIKSFSFHSECKNLSPSQWSVRS